MFPHVSRSCSARLFLHGTDIAHIALAPSQALIPGQLPSSLLASSELEKDHVFRVYDNIAVHWNHTRGKRKVSLLGPPD